ncbi:hypothetical protein Kisp02_31360 [Kineosporia sp. NBRC 101731]|nr:hypothetical protein Kisp02_31360 [Kineosporia sp. NBRC 101731]
MRFRVLGPLEVDVDGVTVPLGAVKQQLALAVLLSRANAVTSMDLLVDSLWADAPPRTARKNLQVYVAGIRKLLGSADDHRIRFGIGGYRLKAEAAELDALQFTTLVAAGRRAAVEEGPAAAAGLLRSALDLWRGPVLEGLTTVPVLAEYAEQLDRLFPAAFEDWADAELADGNAAKVVDEICTTAARYAFRERLRGLQMRALGHCERQGEALAVFDELRQSLARELGLQPGAALQQLYRRVLDGDPVDDAAAWSVRTPRRVPPPLALPPDLPDFVGRDAETDDLTGVLTGGGDPIALVRGPVGAGKTAVAVHVAHRLADRFPHGRIMVRLRFDDGSPRPPVSVLSEVLRRVGAELPPRAAGPLDTIEALGQAWQDWARKRRVLLVVDGAGLLAPPPPGLLPVSGPGAALVTGRPWGGQAASAVPIELAPLTVAEAVELITALIGASRVAADRPAAQRLVIAAGLWPAAVRAAGLKLRRLRHLPLAEFADRLGETGRLLPELSGSEADLGRLVEADLTDLGAPERAALHQLGHLPAGSFSLTEAAGLLDTDPATALHLLEALIEHDLITPPTAEVSAHAVRYEIPFLIASFVRSRTDPGLLSSSTSQQ